MMALSHAERNSIVIIADDYQFLDTMRGLDPAVAYEWLLASKAERIAALVERKPLAFVVDLHMQSMDAIEVLELLGSLRVTAKLVLLVGSNMRLLGKTRTLGAALGLDIVGTLPRPLMMEALVDLLLQDEKTPHKVSAEEFKVALDSEQLLLHYQPIVQRDAGRWKVGCVEALIRWQHPQRGLLYPGQFLQIAESSGQMGQLNDFVMRTALRQASLWERTGLDLNVAVNIAPNAVQDMGFVDQLLAAAHRYKVGPSRIVLEMFEGTSLKDRELLLDVFTRLRLQGVSLSLDDLGTGNCALTDLYRLPFTDVKIDRTLINDVPHVREATVIVSGIISVAHRLSMHVCAEGVETASTFAFLEEAGCDSIQGILIAKPVPAEDMEHSIAQWSHGALAAYSTRAVI